MFACTHLLNQPIALWLQQHIVEGRRAISIKLLMVPYFTPWKKQFASELDALAEIARISSTSARIIAHAHTHTHHPKSIIIYHWLCLQSVLIVCWYSFEISATETRPNMETIKSNKIFMIYHHHRCGVLIHLHWMVATLAFTFVFIFAFALTVDPALSTLPSLSPLIHHHCKMINSAGNTNLVYGSCSVH